MLPSKQDLEGMKRADLQKLCKDFGLKANLKSESLISMLLDANKSNSRSTEQPRNRSVSTRKSSRRSSARISSVIIHDDDDEDDQESEHEDENQPAEPAPPRTRKAKETQTRLGVGKPTIAGGSGARAVTKSLSVPKGKRGRSTKLAKPVEDTIIEEPETSEQPEPEGHETQTGGDPEPAPLGMVALSDVDQRIADALQPLLQQVKSLKAELEKMQTLKSELAELKQKYDSLTTEVATLHERVDVSAGNTEQLEQLKETVSGILSTRDASQAHIAPLNKSPKSPVPSGSEPAPESSHPGFAPVMLGKRHRDSTASNMLVDEDQQDQLSELELAKRVVRPSKKRARVQDQPDSDPPQLADGMRTPPGQRFTVYTGSEPGPSGSSYVDPPPPTNQLPAFYTASGSGPPVTPPPPAFSFNFTVPPSPGPGFPSNFPFPEAPPSPSPAGHSDGNIFKNIIPRSRSGFLGAPSSSLGGFIDPSTLDGDTAATDSSKRTNTMYGTELDGDSRFGDFGVEGGVGGSFWTGGRF
ncbi:hypothetical protein C8J56DRAFT_919443 [Mycena floridula]|nr:hypothetical protein C8J56DRAFT_919443 [Mycena floridula]